jgi:hypothetical protein
VLRLQKLYARKNIQLRKKIFYFILQKIASQCVGDRVKYWATKESKNGGPRPQGSQSDKKVSVKSESLTKVPLINEQRKLM